MPYKIKNKTVIKSDTRKVVGHSANPKKYIKTLRAIEKGWHPNGRFHK